MVTPRRLGHDLLLEGAWLPLGAVLAGSEQLIERAWEGKYLFGGAMRQAGVLAAAALYALDHHVDRLAEDHARARRLAEGLADAGVPVDPTAVETNFVAIAETAGALERLRPQGVLLSDLRTGYLRAVTHLGIGDDDIEQAIEAIPAALQAERRVSA